MTIKKNPWVFAVLYMAVSMVTEIILIAVVGLRVPWDVLRGRAYGVNPNRFAPKLPTHRRRVESGTANTEECYSLSLPQRRPRGG